MRWQAVRACANNKTTSGRRYAESNPDLSIGDFPRSVRARALAPLLAEDDASARSQPRLHLPRRLDELDRDPGPTRRSRSAWNRSLDFAVGMADQGRLACGDVSIARFELGHDRGAGVRTIRYRPAEPLHPDVCRHCASCPDLGRAL